MCIRIKRRMSTEELRLECERWDFVRNTSCLCSVPPCTICVQYIKLNRLFVPSFRQGDLQARPMFLSFSKAPSATVNEIAISCGRAFQWIYANFIFNTNTTWSAWQVKLKYDRPFQVSTQLNLTNSNTAVTVM